MYRLLLCLLLAAAVTGCASAITRSTQDRYYQIAVTARYNGNWEDARKAWARVVVNSRSSFTIPEKRAVYHYEYGRSLGVTCFFAEAERELLEAYRLDIETSCPAYMSLTELAHLDQKSMPKLPAIMHGC